MSADQRPLVAFFPKAPEVGDEVIIKGKIRDDAEKISVNFCVDCCPSPNLVAYHFKTLFDNNTVVHNFKTGNWNEEIIEDNTWVEGPGADFILTFHFTDDDIVVYTEDEGRNYQYSFPHKLDINDIKTVQVWDDVDYVTEVVFRFAKRL